METASLDKETACSEHRDGREPGTFKELNKDHSRLECIVVGGKMTRDENEEGEKSG